VHPLGRHDQTGKEMNIKVHDQFRSGARKGNWLELIRAGGKGYQGPTLVFWAQVEPVKSNLTSCACQVDLSPSPPDSIQIT